MDPDIAEPVAELIEPVAQLFEPAAVNWVFFASRWLHITSAVLLVGGVFFFRVVLMKYAKRQGGLDPQLLATIGGRWIHTAFGLLLVLLVTGFYNMSVKLEAWRDPVDGMSPHMIFGIKFLVFLAILANTSMAAIPRGAWPQRRPMLLAVNVVLGLLVLALSTLLAVSYR